MSCQNFFRTLHTLLYKSIFASLIPHKPLLFIFKQHIKSSEISIATGNVLLYVYFFFVGKFFVTVDVLFQHSQSVPLWLVKKYYPINFLAVSRSISFSHFAITKVATVLPMILVRALPSLIKRSMPKIKAMAATGI